MRWLKRIALIMLVLILGAGGYAYYQLKQAGIIPRKIYETVPPEIPEYQRPAVLVLSKANGYIHVDAIPAGQAMLKRIAAERGWDIFLTDNAASHNPEDLAKFSVVIWNNVSGDVLTSEQRTAMKDWIEAGGGWVGIHASGGDFSYDWDWYVNTLIGAQFVGHTMSPQFQDADVLVADADSEVTAHLPGRWTVPNEEWYAFDSNVRDKGYKVLLTLDEDSYITKGESFIGQDSMPGEHPIAWRHPLGQGRVLYSAIGHQDTTYDIPEFQQLIANAITWAGELYDESVVPQGPDRRALPAVPVGFEGSLQPTETGSTPYVPVGLSAPKGAPNVLLVMTDDVGFSAASTFGGPVPTPHLDELARSGLRYNRFHTTAICSPTRAALLTGRNHHAAGTGFLADVPSPYPGYTTRIPRSAATVARILRDNGYNTAMFGKDHNVPTVDRGPAGPFEHWPTGRGFETFYGFVAGDTSQWRPALFDGTTPVDLRDRDEDYLLDEDLVDRAINWLHNQQASAPGKPFFMYYAPGTAHAPLHAPEEWIARFRGQFDQGWDRAREEILQRQLSEGVVPPGTRLAERPPEIPPWEGLSEAERKVYARYMEVFAAMLSYQDAQFGRLMSELQRMGMADNTLVIYVQGDNGSSGEGGEHGTLNELAHLSSAKGELPVDVEWLADNLDLLGGPDTYLGYPVGWAFATGTPFPWVKQIASHLGGVRNGMVVSWPEGVTRPGEIRNQYHHVIDVLPTILEATGIPAPEAVDGVPQQPIDGTSMLYSFIGADAPSERNTQYYEILGNRGIYHEGWLANTRPRNMPWQIAKVRAGSDVDSYTWELYNLEEDFSQSRDLAQEHPEKLAEMQAIFDREARRYQVYPVHDTGAMSRVQKLMRVPGAPKMFVPHKTLWGPDIRLSLATAPPIFMLPFSLEVDIEIPEGGANGVIVAAGSRFGGWSFYLDGGVPVATASISPLPGGASRIAAGEPLAAGRHTLRYELDYSGDLRILVNDELRGSGKVERRPHVMAGGGETFDTGRDSNDPVTLDYTDEGEFSGTIHRVDVTVSMPQRK